MRLPSLSAHFRSRLVAILIAIALGATPAQAQIGKPEGLYYKSWGVVIGIENYLLAPKIPGAIEDAKTVAAMLRKLGFEEVVELYDKDASSRRLQQTLVDFLPRKVGRQDRLVIYFAGHTGITQTPSGKDLGYLVPWDAQPGNVSKAVTFEQIKEFSHRSASKHTLLLFDSGVRGWEISAAQALSLEGRSAPEEDTEKRAVQVLTAADKGESAARVQDRSLFVQALVKAVSGEADLDKNGWLMASELGRYVSRQVSEQTKNGQHPVFAQLEGDGDTILIEGRKAAFRLGGEPESPAERQAAAKMQYEQAFALLQSGKSQDEALERLNKALEYDPTFGDAYVLKSYVRLDVVPNIDEALAAGKLAVQYAPNNPDSHYTLGLVYERRGQYAEAEREMKAALAANPSYVDVYFTLGAMYADQMKDQKKAVEAFERYLELGGTHSKAREAVAQARAAQPPAAPPAP
ncbi:MAG TPA: caspase family protein [Nitrospira sp.]|nr:caspase family protein [Nitrospira sp.]